MAIIFTSGGHFAVEACDCFGEGVQEGMFLIVEAGIDEGEVVVGSCENKEDEFDDIAVIQRE